MQSSNFPPDASPVYAVAGGARLLFRSADKVAALATGDSMVLTARPSSGLVFTEREAALLLARDAKVRASHSHIIIDASIHIYIYTCMHVHINT